jgi:hypothetical protein
MNLNLSQVLEGSVHIFKNIPKGYIKFLKIRSHFYDFPLVIRFLSSIKSVCF